MRDAIKILVMVVGAVAMFLREPSLGHEPRRMAGAERCAVECEAASI